jgi:MFS superfamily sulfate permease-like transporter
MKSPISLPRGRDAKNDLIAGLTTGLVQIPDAMASAILAAVKQLVSDVAAIPRGCPSRRGPA